MIHENVPIFITHNFKTKSTMEFFLNAFTEFSEFGDKQVYIPVGCVLPACCPYLPACTAQGQGGVSAPGGFCSGGYLLWGGCLLLDGGVCSWGVCSWEVGSAPRGRGRGCLPGGCLPREVCRSSCEQNDRQV